MSADNPTQKPTGTETNSITPGEIQQQTAPALIDHSPERLVSQTVNDSRPPVRKNKSWLDRGKFVIEVLTLLVVATYTRFAFGQWEEMRKATVAATSSADAATSAANTAQKALADSEQSSQQMFAEIQKQSKAMQRSAAAEQQSSETTAHQLELAERPTIDASIVLTGPLKFDVNGANIELAITLRNTGHSPAMNTGIGILALIGNKGTDAPNHRAETCGQTKYQNGIALFSNAPFLQRMDVVLGNQEIQEGKAEKEFPGSKFGEEFLWPAVVVCIAYHPIFDEKKVYYTSYILDLIRKDDAGTPYVNFKIGEDVPEKNLFLQLHAVGAIQAN